MMSETIIDLSFVNECFVVQSPFWATKHFSLEPCRNTLYFFAIQSLQSVLKYLT